MSVLMACRHELLEIQSSQLRVKTASGLFGNEVRM